MSKKITLNYKNIIIVEHHFFVNTALKMIFIPSSSYTLGIINIEVDWYRDFKNFSGLEILLKDGLKNYSKKYTIDY